MFRHYFWTSCGQKKIKAWEKTEKANMIDNWIMDEHDGFNCHQKKLISTNHSWVGTLEFSNFVIKMGYWGRNLRFCFVKLCIPWMCFCTQQLLCSSNLEILSFFILLFSFCEQIAAAAARVDWEATRHNCRAHGFQTAHVWRLTKTSLVAQYDAGPLSSWVFWHIQIRRTINHAAPFCRCLQLSN